MQRTWPTWQQCLQVGVAPGQGGATVAAPGQGGSTCVCGMVVCWHWSCDTSWLLRWQAIPAWLLWQPCLLMGCAAVCSCSKGELAAVLLGALQVGLAADELTGDSSGAHDVVRSAGGVLCLHHADASYLPS
jgi:hypothetical protein